MIRTDHKLLIYAFEQKPEKASPQQLRHSDFILQYITEIVNHPRTENIIAEAFSRLEQVDMPVIVTTRQLQQAQTEDEELQRILQANSVLKLQ